MQNEETLKQAGFKRWPAWDFKEIDAKGYRLDFKGKTFRAYVREIKTNPFVCMGVVVRDGGIVDRWRDCCSEGSIQKHIERETT